MIKTTNENGIFFVEAPFHILGALEAIKEYQLKQYTIYVRLSGNDKQLMNVVKKFFPNDENIKYLTLQNKKNITLSAYFVTLKILLFMLIGHFKYDYVFLGNFESNFLKLFLRVVPKNKIVLLDDGIKTFFIQAGFTLENNYNIFTMLYRIKPLVNQTIRYNKFKYLKELYKIEDKSHILQKNEILFLGSKLCEEGILDEKKYMSIMHTIVELYSSYKIVYIPHRGENIDKLNSVLVRYKNLTIKEIDYPIEIYLLEEEIIPCKVLSFYSAALLTIKLLYDKIEVNSILFDYSHSCYRNNIDLAYSGLEEYNINILKEISFV